MLGNWVSSQHHKYINRIGCMKNNTFIKAWEIFTNKYKNLFQTNEDDWDTISQEVSEFMALYEKRPSSKSTDTTERKLGTWIAHNIQNYKTNTRNMASIEMRKKWGEFVSKHSQYLKTDNEISDSNIILCGYYIDKNKKLPSTHSSDEQIRYLGNWLSKTRNNNELLKQEKYRKFFEKYSEYFMTPEEKWLSNFEKLLKYTYENNKLPTGSDSDDDIRYLGKWLGTQKRNYVKKIQIMKNKDIYKKWKLFVETSGYFES